MKKFIQKNIAAVYFVLVFVFAWSVWIITGVVAPQKFISATLIGAWSPTIIALLLIGIKDGKQGLIHFLKGLLKWKLNIKWYAIVIFSIPVIAFLSIGIYKIFGGQVPTVSIPEGIPHNIPLPVLALALFLGGIFFGGPLAEDVGWRGFIVPELHKKIPALKASLIVGVIWVIWHLPFFFFKEGRVVIGYMPLPWFTVMTIAWAVLFAWVYFNTKSLIMPVLYHSSINTTLGLFGVLNNKPAEPNTALLLINALLTWLFVVFVIWRYGSKNLVKENQSKTMDMLSNAA